MTMLNTLIPALLLTATPVFVSPDWVREHAGNPKLVILHVAENRSGYNAGHIPGAVFLAYSEIIVNQRGTSTEMPEPLSLQRAFERVGVSDGSTVVVYGEPLTAARAYVALEYIGHTDARILDGGLAAWLRAGHALSQTQTKPGIGSLTIRNTNFLVSADTVLALIGRPGIALIDARPPHEFSGEDGGMGGMHAAGHIPTARNLFWERLVESRMYPVLREEAELRELFRQAGAEPGATLIIYCMVGLRASMAYAVARQLGYDVLFYDGSWVDWSARGLPVEKS